MSLAGTQLNAQLTHTSNEYHASGTGSDVEFATTGNIMPYKVTPFHWGPLTELMKPSTFKRWLNRNTTGYKFLKSRWNHTY